MNRSQQVWRRYIDAWNRHDVDAILDSVTDDFIYDERPATMDRPLQGRQAFRAYLERTFTAFPDLRIEVTSCEAGSTLAVSESHCVFEVRDDRLAHERLYWDLANTLRQLGRFAALLAVAFRPSVSESALVRVYRSGQRI